MLIGFATEKKFALFIWLRKKTVKIQRTSYPSLSFVSMATSGIVYMYMQVQCRKRMRKAALIVWSLFHYLKIKFSQFICIGMCGTLIGYFDHINKLEGH